MKFNPQEIIGNTGKIVFDDLSTIDTSLNIESNIDHLKEDLLQVELINGSLLDVGWYPSFDSKGCFNVCLVEKHNWSEPVYIKKCNSWNELKEAIAEAINFK